MLPIPVFWPGEFHGLYSPWGCKELDTTERLSLSQQDKPPQREARTLQLESSPHSPPLEKNPGSNG